MLADLVWDRLLWYFTWLPSLLVKEGYTIVQSFEYVLVMILAQLPWLYCGSMAGRKLGRKATLAGFIGMCAISAYFFGQSGSVTEIMIWGCLMSFFNLAWGVLYTYTPEQYPTNIRAFGSGWAVQLAVLAGLLHLCRNPFDGDAKWFQLRLYHVYCGADCSGCGYFSPG